MAGSCPWILDGLSGDLAAKFWLACAAYVGFWPVSAARPVHSLQCLAGPVARLAPYLGGSVLGCGGGAPGDEYLHPPCGQVSTFRLSKSHSTYIEGCENGGICEKGSEK